MAVYKLNDNLYNVCKLSLIVDIQEIYNKYHLHYCCYYYIVIILVSTVFSSTVWLKGSHLFKGLLH